MYSALNRLATSPPQSIRAAQSIIYKDYNQILQKKNPGQLWSNFDQNQNENWYFFFFFFGHPSEIIKIIFLFSTLDYGCLMCIDIRCNIHLKIQWESGFLRGYHTLSRSPTCTNRSIHDIIHLSVRLFTFKSMMDHFVSRSLILLSVNLDILQNHSFLIKILSLKQNYMYFVGNHLGL